MKFITLLRRVNVSGKNKLNMKELCVQLEENGFKNPTYYIQSGNLIFDSYLSEEEINQKIHSIILNEFKLEVPCLSFSLEYLEKLLNNASYKSEAEANPKQVSFTFMKDTISNEEFNSLQELCPSNEYLSIGNKCIYIHTPDGYGKAKMNNNFIEKKLKQFCTTRNWNTVNKLFELASE